MSAITYNRFQYYSKLRTYALDDSALVSATRASGHGTAGPCLLRPQPRLFFRAAQSLNIPITANPRNLVRSILLGNDGKMPKRPVPVSPRSYDNFTCQNTEKT
jgi:hypothetical protein